MVDDSPSIDGEIFNLEEFEGADWVLISDEVPVDESRRDELLEDFQATYHGGDGRAVPRTPPTTTRARSSRTPRRPASPPRSSRSPVAARRLPRRCAPSTT